MKKWISAGIVSLSLFACGGNAENKTEEKQPSNGKSVYEAQCVRCHGSNGKLGLSGAKDLSTTSLTPSEMIPVITNGSNGGMMPAFKEGLSETEIQAVADYIETTLKN